MAARETINPPHVPVMLAEVLSALSPRDWGVYVDGTFGAGGYTRAILGAADCRVIAIDRDPSAISSGQAMVAEFMPRLSLREGRFADMEALAGDARIDGIVLDIGVSSMQLDEAERGFSFLRDGPLDMRMAQAGTSAADAVNTLPQEMLSNIIYVFGEEPRSRAIARAIVEARKDAPITTTQGLVKAIERATGRPRPDKIHPATRTFQALRIHVNGELDELVEALHAAERMLPEGGRLVVVTFHSLEDRIVKRFFASRAGKLPSGSRHLPGTVEGPEPSFTLPFKGHLGATDEEARMNPRARSAKLRAGVRTAAPAMPAIADEIGLSVRGTRH
ncbi:16S rRNA (cytosine(1402)-N(4))-methyltransferase [Aestuariivirga litoralis]|uniref:Ribosomal RNA small subunit methyltransferase H n=1 Tax=Aestuariivirga litoralis TaxID=2650924 RepID=A0A2W2AQU9_9HYPH|nr:16S rRNA (cytosine(1402)-N(4))-methyltransferase RsmH [Aestuariivirga litoralis]PZF76002.1 16S rRNA (cytosine(1402)-N(4))-methyltransferase [Aestuariivirga litoralis]